MKRSGMSGGVMRRRKRKKAARDANVHDGRGCCWIYRVQFDRDLDMNNIPALPSIEGDLLLDVLTRQSHRHTSSPPDNSEHGGAERLAELGHTVLSMIIMYILFQRTPFISAADLSVCYRFKPNALHGSSPYRRRGTKN